ncbi:TPA: hypothetical protein HA259_04925 [Thermoplasmata archaeon]|nr:hypothetical protein [Thermoplasmata archaeon]
MGNNPSSTEELIATNKGWKFELTAAYGEQPCAGDDAENALSYPEGFGGKLHSGRGPQ